MSSADITNPRKTKVLKSVERTIWTAKYEGLKICVGFEEEITWSSMEERQQKLDSITKHLNNELIKTIIMTCKELNLEEKAVFKAKDEIDPKKDGVTVSGFDSL